MNKLFIFLLLLTQGVIFSQDYFKGKQLYCETDDPEAKRLFDIGIETLHLNTSLNKKYLKRTSDVFFKAYLADTTFCDAAFFTGYTLRLLNDENAFGFYYMADSLSNNKSREFKSNLAAEALRFGSEEGIDLARKKYNEMVDYFPEDPEGYYGISLTSTAIGDIDNGIEKINIAIDKYNGQNDDALLLKAILLTLNSRHEEALDYYEKVKREFRRDDNFNGNYALSLFEVSEKRGDEEMMRLAKKHYRKVENKDELTEEMRKRFER